MKREATNKILEMVDEGLIPAYAVLSACLSYMSEDDVADMCHANDFFYGEEDDDE